ncbi:MAG: hypothetical protein V7637_3308 [Mycobacteriales bacterium]|jgi:hypothetical protein
MTEAAHARGTSETGRFTAYDETRRTGWVGWVIFAGVMMFMLGCFEVIAALVALFEDQYYLVGPSGLVVSVDYTAWGWAHLIIGAVAICAGAGVMLGQTWARVIGIILAVVSAVTNMAFMAAYPAWSILLIALDVIVVYALAMHGGEVTSIES